jgi:hypothetical protein
MSLLSLNTKHRVSGPGFVQAVAFGSGSISALAVTLNNVVAGNAIVVVASWVGTATVSSATDSNGSLTAGPTNPAALGSAVNQVTYYHFNAASGSHTLTVNISSGHNYGIVAYEISGITAQDTVVRATAGTTATSITTPTLTPGGSPGILIATCMAYANVTSMTNPPTGFTSGGGVVNNVAVSESAYKITSSGASASWSWSGSTAESNAFIVSFK